MRLQLVSYNVENHWVLRAVWQVGRGFWERGPDPTRAP